jgi:hypothetical protein
MQLKPQKTKEKAHTSSVRETNHQVTPPTAGRQLFARSHIRTAGSRAAVAVVAAADCRAAGCIGRICCSAAPAAQPAEAGCCRTAPAPGGGAAPAAAGQPVRPSFRGGAAAQPAAAQSGPRPVQPARGNHLRSCRQDDHRPAAGC